MTMLQRSPTFFITRPNVNELADTLRSLEVAEEWMHEIVRRQVIKMQDEMTRRCVDEPDAVAKELIEAIRGQLPRGYRRREALHAAVPAVAAAHRLRARRRPLQEHQEGKASVVTDEIEAIHASRGSR